MQRRRRPRPGRGNGLVRTLAPEARRISQRADGLTRAGFLGRVGEDLVFPTLPTAVRAYADAYRARHGVSPDGVPPEVL